MSVSDLNVYSGGLLGLLYASGPVAKAVVTILFVFSVLSWTIIFFKWNQLRKAEQDGDAFLRVIKESDSLKGLTNSYRNNPESVFYKLLVVSYKELSRNKEQAAPKESLPYVENMLKVAVAEEMERLERRLSFLATTANTAPFIGLFGTVWGIMDSFREIGVRGTTSLAVVAPGISEALITTALGLATAIPAVLAYNYLSGRVKGVSSKMENASVYIINLLAR